MLGDVSGSTEWTFGRVLYFNDEGTVASFSSAGIFPNNHADAVTTDERILRSFGEAVFRSDMAHPLVEGFGSTTKCEFATIVPTLGLRVGSRGSQPLTRLSSPLPSMAC